MTRTNARRDKMIEMITDGQSDVEALAERLGVSSSTVRRDLATLSRQGAITRTYGGAVLAQAAAEQTFSIRERTNRSAKDAIARAALSLIDDGDVVLLDSGSTVGALGRVLAGREVRVVTTNLALVPVLIRRGIEVVTLGGSVRPISMGVVGPLAEMTLRRLTVDKVFLGCDGVVAGRGVCEASSEQCALKELMMERAAAVTVLADSSKLGRASQRHWAPLPARWTLVTDDGAALSALAPFANSPDVRVIQGVRNLSELAG